MTALRIWYNQNAVILGLGNGETHSNLTVSVLRPNNKAYLPPKQNPIPAIFPLPGPITNSHQPLHHIIKRQTNLPPTHVSASPLIAFKNLSIIGLVTASRCFNIQGAMEAMNPAFLTFAPRESSF